MTSKEIYVSVLNSPAAYLTDLRSICILDFNSVTEYFAEFVRLVSFFRRSGGLRSSLGPDELIPMLIDVVPNWDETWWEAREELDRLYEVHSTRLTVSWIREVLHRHEAHRGQILMRRRLIGTSTPGCRSR